MHSFLSGFIYSILYIYNQSILLHVDIFLSFLLMYSIPLYLNVFICSVVGIQVVSSLELFADSTALTILVSLQLNISVHFFWVQLTRRGIGGSQSICVKHFHRYCQTVSQSDCTIYIPTSMNTSIGLLHMLHKLVIVGIFSYLVILVVVQGCILTFYFDSNFRLTENLQKQKSCRNSTKNSCTCITQIS